MLAILFLQAITGAHTPACLFAANNPVETVTPPSVCSSTGRQTSLVYAKSCPQQKKAARTESARAGRPVTQLVELNLKLAESSVLRINDQLRELLASK